MRPSNAHRIFGFATLVLAATFAGACSEAESRDDPEQEILTEERLEGETEEAGQPVRDATDPQEEEESPRVERRPEESAAPVRVVTSGTPLRFRLTESVSTATHAEGDRFDAVLVGDVTSDDGRVLIPSGASAQGVVDRAHKSTGGDDPAMLALRLQSVRVDGRSVDMAGSVVSGDLESDTRDTSGETAAKIAVGAAAGAVLGRVIGKSTEGALIGTGAGAVAGTIVAMSTKGGDAKIDEGSTVTLTLTEPLVLP